MSRQHKKRSKRKSAKKHHPSSVAQHRVSDKKTPEVPAVAETAEASLDPGRLMRLATYFSVGVALTLIVLKFIAYLKTDSVAMLTSLVDSSLDAAASIVNLVAVRHALQPADDEHRFGHGKAEALAGLAQAAFIAGSAFFLLIEAVHRLLYPKALDEAWLGVQVMVISIILTIALVVYQRYVIRRTASLAISADSLHYVGDILANASVILALVMTSTFNWSYADPVLAIAITIYVVRSAWSIISQAYKQLMDHELPDPDRLCIRGVALAHPFVANVHDLRTRVSGQTRFIQFHLEMRGDLTLSEAHTVSDQVEKQLLRVYPNAEVLIHEDPIRGSSVSS